MLCLGHPSKLVETLIFIKMNIMKRTICLAILAVLLMTGCSKSSATQGTEQYNGYIFFSQQVLTKAPLVEDTEDLGQQKIGVVGFKYDNSTTWSEFIAKTPSPVPNVFYDATSPDPVPVEELVCSKDGSATYSPLQGWSNTKKYAFFAFYPFTGAAGSSGSTNPCYEGLVNFGDATNKQYKPAIKYTLDLNNLKASMVDVMTASSDKDLTQGEVMFKLDHRLACLGILMKNSTNGFTIELSKVTVKIEGIQYTEALLALDGADHKYTQPGTSIAEQTFELDLAEDLDLAEVGVQIGANAEKQLSDKLIFIPQEQNLTATITITYTRKDPNGVYSDITYENVELTPATTKLEEGVKHLIHLNFKDSEVTVTAKTDGAWGEDISVDNTFN